jgi:hypothetical protein
LARFFIRIKPAVTLKSSDYSLQRPSLKPVLLYGKYSIGTGTTSVSDPDPHLISFLDPGGVKSAEIEGENEAKRQIIHHQKLISCTGIKAYLRLLIKFVKSDFL